MFYSILAYYFFTFVENPQEEVRRHQAFFETRDIKGRIYISNEGINGQMSASHLAAQEYMEWLRSDPRFEKVEFKIHSHHEHVFPRAAVKVRSQLVAFDEKVDMALTGEHVSASAWKKMLEERDDQTLVLDVRNDYEWELGHFEGAELPDLDKFRAFPAYAKELRKTRNPKTTKVMMYCTGGIRCELYSALLKQEGFDKVFQLHGGVIQYGLEEGAEHWKGKLFVFDDRLSIPIADQDPGETISACRFCKEKTDLYFNCANMDCNELFLSCAPCAEKFQGCCCETCQTAPRLRAFEKTDRPKPYRRVCKSSKIRS